jgi:hypothetical protein
MYVVLIYTRIHPHIKGACMFCFGVVPRHDMYARIYVCLYIFMCVHAWMHIYMYTHVSILM